MTVHASKGLEFPVVVLPGLGDPPIADNKPLLAQRIAGEWHLACRVEDPVGAIQTRVSPGAWHALAQQRRRETDAERRRLLYVGVTRARDHLLLLGRRAGIGHDTWVDHICPDEAAPPDRHLQVHSTDSLPPAPPPPALPTRSPPGLALDLPDLPQPLVLSPSGLDRLVSCPARWYRSGVLGLEEPAAKDLSSGFASRKTSTVRGTAFHRILEQGLLGDLGLARRCWTGEATREGFPLEEMERGWEALLPHLVNARESEPLQHCLSNPGENELGVQAALGDVVLRGVLDRLWQDRDTGAWQVLDYKSDHVQTQDELERATRSHSLQLLAYGWAANQILAGADGGVCRQGQIFFSALGAWVELPSWTDDDFQRVEACLHDAGRVAQSDWPAVLAAACSAPEAPPCASCGYLGQGCPGVSPGGDP